MPMSLTLVEAIAGEDKARAVARELGVMHWDARHDSNAFKFTRPFALAATRNRLAFWQQEHLGIALTPGVDEVSLALVADAWSRTYRSRAVTFAPAAGAIRSRNGIGVIPDQIAATWPAALELPAVGTQRPAMELEAALRGIAVRYGARTADFVAMQLEYPRQRPPS